MQKIFGIGFIVLALWFAVEIFTGGTRGAFGGRLAPYLGGGGDGRPLTEQVRARSQAAAQKQIDRTQRVDEAESPPAN
jgi:hypothetical protein